MYTTRSSSLVRRGSGEPTVADLPRHHGSRQGFRREHRRAASATVLPQNRQDQAEQKGRDVRRADVAAAISGGARHVEQHGSVGDPFRRAHQQQPLPRVGPLNRFEAQNRPVAGLRAAVLEKEVTYERSREK